ncbi:DUF4276 family protein [Gordonia sp. (in: high G+C Gram-positive bacteria)]|uniref:DUF4276 family protein n=1 Tax=Gordonia sp. (in: high G+C Gram-positive bacteria) TaxID=84139 RepID=UPI003527E709
MIAGDSPLIAPIVEGKGEQDAIGVLLRTIAGQQGGYLRVAQPFRLDSAKMRKPEELARAVRVQAARVSGAGGVLIIRDGDDKDVACVVELAAELAEVRAVTTVPVEVVIAVPEFEAWILASIDSMRAHRAVRDDAGPVLDPEARRDAKGRLQEQLCEPYRETIHQAQFAATIDVGLAQERSRSFLRLVRAVATLTTPPDVD